MADMATPSAAAMTTNGDAPKTNGDVAPGEVKPSDTKANGDKVVKPDKPDEEAYKKELDTAEKELGDCNEKLKSIKAKLDQTKPNIDTPERTRMGELRTQLSTIRTQQSTGKASRGAIQDKIKRLDEQLKTAISDDKAARSKTRFKSADQVQAEIDRLQAQVDTGTMKIVDEKKALSEVTTLNKLKKGFVADTTGERISGFKSQIAELKKSLDDPESKALSERYNVLNAEYEKLKTGQDDVYKNINQLRDERTKAHEAQNKAYGNVKEIKDRFYAQRKAYREYENEAWKIRKAKKDDEQKTYLAGKKKAHARERLEEASAPAYQSEIQAAEGLVRYLDPSQQVKSQEAAGGKFAAQASRTVTDDAPKGRMVLKKDEEDFMVLGGGKKKKARQHHEKEKYQLSMGVIEQFSQVGIEPPMSQADVPAKVEALTAKIAEWKADQDRKTKENIAKAQKEIDELDAKMESTAL